MVLFLLLSLLSLFSGRGGSGATSHCHHDDGRRRRRHIIHNSSSSSSRSRIRRSIFICRRIRICRSICRPKDHNMYNRNNPQH